MQRTVKKKHKYPNLQKIQSFAEFPNPKQNIRTFGDYYDV